MNERGAISVKSLKQNILNNPPHTLLYLAIFGSQARGTERPDSDLDILYVVRGNESLSPSVVRKAAKIPGGVKMVTIIPHTLESIQREANVYGTVEYRVLHDDDTYVMYQSSDFDMKLHPEVDYEYSVNSYLQSAKASIFTKNNCSELLLDSACFDMFMAIDNMLRALLLFNRKKFPYTRDMHVLYEMLPPKHHPPMDVDVVMLIHKKYYQNIHDEQVWSQEEVSEAKHMAKQVYDFISQIIQPTAIPAR